MTLNPRHIALFIGIITIFISFLFFGRDTNTYDILLLTGLAISLISFITILCKKDTLKNKVIWTLIMVFSAWLLRLTEPLLVKVSYRQFVSANSSRLTKLNNIILTKRNGLLFIPYSDTIPSDDFSQTEIAEMQSLLSGTKISLIQKDSTSIFYRTFGMLDVAHGVFYFYGHDKPDKRFDHISGNWFY